MKRKKAFQIISDALKLSKPHRPSVNASFNSSPLENKLANTVSELEQVPEAIRLYLGSKLCKLSASGKFELVSHFHQIFTNEIDQTVTTLNTLLGPSTVISPLISQLLDTLERTVYIIEESFPQWLCQNSVISAPRHSELIKKLEPRHYALASRFAFHNSNRASCNHLNAILFYQFFDGLTVQATHRQYQTVRIAIEEFERRLTGVSPRRAISSDMFIEVLIAVEFNHPEFITFLGDQLKANLRRCQSWKARSKLVVDYQKRLNSIYTVTKCTFSPELAEVKKQISVLLSSEADSLDAEAKFQLQPLTEKSVGQPIIELGISNETFAALLRVLLEAGVVKAENRKALAKHVAKAVRSEKGKPIGEIAFYQNLMAPEIQTLEKLQYLVESKLPAKIFEVIEKKTR